MSRFSRCALMLLASSLALPMSACGRQTDDVADDDTGTAESSTDTSTDTGETEGGELVCEGERCHPLEDDCPDGELCTFFSPEFLCTPSTGDGSGDFLAPCDSQTSCNEGLACISSEFFTSCAHDACCTPHCDLSGVNTCPNTGDGVFCMPWLSHRTNTDPCYVNAGVCGTGN